MKDPFEAFESDEFASFDQELSHPESEVEIDESEFDWGDVNVVQDHSEPVILAIVEINETETAIVSPDPMPEPEPEPEPVGVTETPEEHATGQQDQVAADQPLPSDVRLMEIAKQQVEVYKWERKMKYAAAKHSLLHQELYEMTSMYHANTTEPGFHDETEIEDDKVAIDPNPAWASVETSTLEHKLKGIEKFGAKKLENLIQAAPTYGDLYKLIVDRKLSEIKLFSRDTAEQVEIIFYEAIEAL